MPADSEHPKIFNPLPVVLIAAVVQGWVLYGLHHSIDAPHWPATQPAWLLALYAVAILIPLTIQLLADHVRQATTWLIVAAVTVLFGYFGWHHGANVMDRSAERFVSSGEWFPLALVLGVLWLLTLPFIQFRLAEGHWRVRYQSLFATAWRNKLTLAEAALFTCLFWLLLFLWQELFRMLGILFFKELFDEPIFVYPVTSLTFGIALYLIGSLERLTSVVLQQILNVLKWLAIVAGLILALFTVALALKLPGMVVSGNRAISAAWLLWLVAVTVLLINAAYRDGSVAQPYPKWLAVALRCVIPLTVVIALTALYALYVRVGSYGFTVERVWACIVAAAACIYAGGYTFAATRRGRWMEGLERINIATAVFLIVVISLALTPLLSPYRIAANSQFAHAQSRPELDAEPPNLARVRYEVTPYQYLRFNAGVYGMARLRELARVQNHPRAAEIREAAETMLARANPWDPPSRRDLSAQLDSMTLYPAGRALDAGLRNRLLSDVAVHDLPALNYDGGGHPCGIFADLDGDGVEEFVLLAPPSGLAYQLRSGEWQRAGGLVSGGVGYNVDLSGQLKAGNVHVEERKWRDLRVGPYVFRRND